MISYKQYLFTSLILTCISLFCVGTISYIVDPANIYHDSSDTRNSPSVFVDHLIKSQNGLLWPGDSWNIRDIKKSFVQNKTTIDCAVIGSSRVMQISSFRENKSLTNLCDSITNIGVAGGALEDYLALSYELINRKRKPNTFIFGIDPWTLNFGQDERWERHYRDSYYSMKNMINPNSNVQENNRLSWLKYIANLINPHYFFRSAKQIGRDDFVIEEAPEFDYSKGIDSAVLLPDGSVIYSNRFISDANQKQVPIGGINYRLGGHPFSEAAIELFSDLVKHLNKAGVSTIVILTPYQHNVWADKNSITVKSLMMVESRVRKLGDASGITILGSFNPNNIGCTPDEFFDFMHAKDSCLSKIKN